MTAQSFEFNFRGRSDNGIDYDSGMIINGDPETIGRMLAEYANKAATIGQPEPVRILIAAFKQMEVLNPTNGKIIKPKFIN